MTQGNLEERVRQWGKEHMKVDNPAIVLINLQKTDGKKVRQIAEMFGVKPSTVRYLMKKLKVPNLHPRLNFEGIVKSCGYKSIDDFFLRNPSLTFKTMGKMLKVNQFTVARHYYAWSERVKSS